MEFTNHINNTTSYLVEINDFSIIVYDIETEVLDMIRITVYEEENNIYKVILDLTNYFEDEYIMVFEPR